LRAVVGFAAGQVKGKRQAVEVRLRSETTAGAGERLVLLPPFASAAET